MTGTVPGRARPAVLEFLSAPAGAGASETTSGPTRIGPGRSRQQRRPPATGAANSRGRRACRGRPGEAVSAGTVARHRAQPQDRCPRRARRRRGRGPHHRACGCLPTTPSSSDRNRFASWTGTAPIEASSGEIVRHRLSPGTARRRSAASGSTSLRPWSCPRRCGSCGSSAGHRRPTPWPPQPRASRRAREGTAGRLTYPARPASTRTPALRISHFPDPHQRRYPRRSRHGRPGRPAPSSPRLDNRREPLRRIVQRAPRVPGPDVPHEGGQSG